MYIKVVKVVGANHPCCDWRPLMPVVEIDGKLWIRDQRDSNSHWLACMASFEPFNPADFASDEEFTEVDLSCYCDNLNPCWCVIRSDAGKYEMTTNDYVNCRRKDAYEKALAEAEMAIVMNQPSVGQEKLLQAYLIEQTLSVLALYVGMLLVYKESDADVFGQDLKKKDLYGSHYTISPPSVWENKHLAQIWIDLATSRYCGR